MREPHAYAPETTFWRCGAES